MLELFSIVFLFILSSLIVIFVYGKNYQKKEENGSRVDSLSESKVQTATTKEISNSTSTSNEKSNKAATDEREYPSKLDEFLAKNEEEALDFLLQKKQEKYRTETIEEAEVPDVIYPDGKFEPIILPKDEQGFLQTFSPDQEEEYFQFFKQYGLVAIQVLSDEECDKSLEEVWSFLERCHPFLKKDDPSTWETTWPIYSHISVSGDTPILSPQMFNNRQNPKIHRIFSVLYGTPKLWVSVDRASISRPTRKVPIKIKSDPSDPSDPSSSSSGTPTSEWKLVNKEEWRLVGHEGLHWEINPWTGKSLLSGFTSRDPNSNRGFERWKLLGFLSLQDCASNDGAYYGVPGFHNYFKIWSQRNKHLMNLMNLPFQVPMDDSIRKECQKFPIRKGCILILHPAIPFGSCPNDSARGRIIQYLRMIPQDDMSISPWIKKEWLPLNENGFQLTDLGEKLLGLEQWS